MSKRGRPCIYKSKEEAAEAKKKQTKESKIRCRANMTEEQRALEREKDHERLKNNPELQKRRNAQKKASKDRKKLEKQLLNLLSAIWEIKRNETNHNFQKALKNAKQLQAQSLAEQSEMFDYKPSK